MIKPSTGSGISFVSRGAGGSGGGGGRIHGQQSCTSTPQPIAASALGGGGGSQWPHKYAAEEMMPSTKGLYPERLTCPVLLRQARFWFAECRQAELTWPAGGGLMVQNEMSHTHDAKSVRIFKCCPVS